MLNEEKMKRSCRCVNTIPWIGMDIGCTLTKLVYFEPKICGSGHDSIILNNIRKYLTQNHVYGKSGHRDSHLQMNDIEIRRRQGSLHFIRFHTSQMRRFLSLAKEKGIIEHIPFVCATGGGAFKFERRFREQARVKMIKYDELDMLIKGILFAEVQNRSECFYYDNPYDIQNSKKRRFDFSEPFPFILVNVGSGVSILTVHGPNHYKRVSGSSLGGGTFLGLCCLLTGCTSYEEAILLASKGNHKNVDKLVKDIYGGDYNRYGLSGNLVASSFGKMHLPRKRALVSREDLASATLFTITNNIGSITQMHALVENIQRIVFVGNFLRVNPISMKLFAHAMQYWSDGKKKAIFLEHEGYFGALGCMLQFNDALTCDEESNCASGVLSVHSLSEPKKRLVNRENPNCDHHV